MLRVVESDKLSGTTAWAKCQKLSLASGDTVRLVVHGYEAERVYVTLREGVVFENVLAVSPAVWARLHDLTGSGHIEAEPVPLSFGDVMRRKFTARHVAGILALLTAVLVLFAAAVTAFLERDGLVLALCAVGAACGVAAFVVAWRGTDR
ncbi:hypothetical protein FKR81_29380 [Lentzea tibetensis]|uniref:Uncharacterized protein n=1 Tax=Lentzea tibetensis TaxID=2591470 RepID=A0A563ELV1_9PSEU|nr:hypothetical protein [Lentzea tibetensis]TWP48096.1 hypothetical protein FKR81_29380 [Lentzea tibetensis]